MPSKGWGPVSEGDESRPRTVYIVPKLLSSGEKKGRPGPGLKALLRIWGGQDLPGQLCKIIPRCSTLRPSTHDKDKVARNVT
jgi:hypothetical protein